MTVNENAACEHAELQGQRVHPARRTRRAQVEIACFSKSQWIKGLGKWGFAALLFDIGDFCVMPRSLQPSLGSGVQL